MPNYIEVQNQRSGGAVKRSLVPMTTLTVGNLAAQPVTVAQYVWGGFVTLDFTLTDVPVTLTKNGTSTGGGGTLLFTFNEGLVLPFGGSSNLTIAAAGDKSFLASVGSAAAGTDGTLTSTEISFLPSTAATTSSNVGTCKMKSTSTTPTPGSPLDGSSTPVALYLNSALNADATGVESLTYSGTIRIIAAYLGDS